MTIEEERQEGPTSFDHMGDHRLPGGRPPGQAERGSGARVLLWAFAPTYEITARAIRVLGLGAVSGTRTSMAGPEARMEPGATEAE